jgi:hypothetical protein
MLYKTICLHLLEDRPSLYEQLRQDRKLLPTLNRLAEELKLSQQAWQKRLPQTRTGSPEQIASEAMELAVNDLAASLPSKSPDEDNHRLDEAMAAM